MRERARTRDTTNVLARMWRRLQYVTVGYGYRPVWAVYWFVAIWLGGAMYYAATPPPPAGGGSAAAFHPAWYALDLLLPIVTLGQQNRFTPSGTGEAVAFLLVLAGLALVSTIAAAASRVLRRT
jgi:hypothetical protein